MRKAAKPSPRKKRIPGQAKGHKPLPDTRSDAENRDANTVRRAAINIFILFHLVAITCVALPWNLPITSTVKDLVRPYMRWTGLYQTWDMFGPDPERVNSYVKSVLVTQDHHMRVWSFPRMEELSFGERYEKERYRKFLEVLPQTQYALLWPDVARHLARSLNNQSDPLDKVMLIQFQSEIRPGVDDSHEPTPRPNVFYDDYLQPGDLK
ncbi:MAG TPA: hypothetical protein VN828_01725 [Acidobacteriaceae bacterium]|nr:hypothetical protein [Acidobacteriaceae bacterium]